MYLDFRCNGFLRRQIYSLLNNLSLSPLPLSFRCFSYLSLSFLTSEFNYLSLSLSCSVSFILSPFSFPSFSPSSLPSSVRLPFPFRSSPRSYDISGGYIVHGIILTSPTNSYLFLPPSLPPSVSIPLTC